MKAFLRLLIGLAALILLNPPGPTVFSFATTSQQKSVIPFRRALGPSFSAFPQAVYVTVYLEGDFPYPIARYKKAVETLLAEMRAISSKPFYYTFVNPAKNPEVLQLFKRKGVQPIPIHVRVSQTETRRQYLYPLAVVHCGLQDIWVDLVKGNLRPTGEIDLLEAEQDVEYKMAAALRQIAVYGEKPIIGVLTGHGEYTMDQMPQLKAELERFYRVLPVRVREGQALAPR
ncbi:MAG: hypothetical protein KatS3mg026_0045 [Bacteroidia bacterium]|nr:MAG: hypothetical protein KatS3mg026_0045 [Bacteroidia bacterium]